MTIDTSTTESTAVNNCNPFTLLWHQASYIAEQLKDLQFAFDELTIAFLKSFFTAFLKKTSIDELNQYLQIERSTIKKFLVEAIMVLMFSVLCAQIFGYSFLFSLTMESTNHILRRTGNAHWTMVSSPAFYAPGIIINMMNNPEASDTSIVALTERLMRSGASGLGGLLGWFLAILLTLGPNARRAQQEKLCHAAIRAC